MTRHREHTREQMREAMKHAANKDRDIANEMAAMYGGCDDPLHPFMPGGDDQPFRDWIDFVNRVARPLVDAEQDEAAEQAAMALYRKASPYFICTALVMAANRAGQEVTMAQCEETFAQDGRRCELPAAHNLRNSNHMSGMVEWNTAPWKPIRHRHGEEDACPGPRGQEVTDVGK